MHITIVAVGQKLPAWAQTAVEDYLARFPRDFTVAVKEVKAEPRTGGKPVSQVMALEAERIEKAVPAGDIVVAMDEHGRDMTTVDFANKFAAWKNEGCGVTFVIGGADGLDPALKSCARLMLRLSSMTLPHAFARVLLTEQIYRAWSILANHPYHRV
jgi:ribosomal RNA large subunit methyltransferase H